VGRPLWREDGSAFCICCWSLPVQSFSGLSPLRLETIFYCLRFETSLFVASYDSQDDAENIRPRPHTGYFRLYQTLLLITSSDGPHRKHFRVHSKPIVTCVFFSTGTCLFIRSLETGWITQLFICLLHSNECTCYNTKYLGYVGFVVDKVALGQVSSEYFGFPCQSSFHQLLHNHPHLSSGAGTIGQLVADVPSWLILTPLRIMSRVGYVTRLITSRCQGCSDYLLWIHSYTQLFTLAVSPGFWPNKLVLPFEASPFISAVCGLSRRHHSPRFDFACSATIASGTSRLIRCYLTNPPSLGKRVCWFCNSYATAYCYNVTMEVPTPNTLQ
jgi:hypothetical protein